MSQDHVLTVDSEYYDEDQTSTYLRGGWANNEDGAEEKQKLLDPTDLQRATTTVTAGMRMQIIFEDICMKATKINEETGEIDTNTILRNVSGVFHPGKMTAIMGTTGAGKTSLMNIIAGRLQGGTAQTYGRVLVNGVAVDEDLMKMISGYVMQDDVILETMTVREAIMMSAILRLPKSKTLARKNLEVDDIIVKLNLKKTENSLVGGALQKGISGGEKKRVAVAMEMVTKPSILFLDEPTSGLDTFIAYQVCHTLKGLAKENFTVVSTIHQPSSDVFKFFDDLLIVHAGQIVFHGPRERLVPYFEEKSFICPADANPADYLFMQVLNDHINELEESLAAAVDQDQNAEAAKKKQKEEQSHKQAYRLQTFVDGWLESEDKVRHIDNVQSIQGGVGKTYDQYMEERPDWSAQFSLLARRSFYNTIRNELLLKARVAHIVSMSLLIGILYWQMDNDQDSIGDREGAIYMMICSSCLVSTTGVLPAFFEERDVFLREYNGGVYTLPPYFFSKVLVDLPFRIILPMLGCCVWYWMTGMQDDAVCFIRAGLLITFMEMSSSSVGSIISATCEDINVGLGIAPLTIIPFIVFSGYLVNLDNIPVYYSFMPWLSPMKYTFVGMVKNEFEGLTFYCKDDQEESNGACEYTTGEEVVTSLAFDDQGTVELNIFVLVGLFFVLTTVAYYALWSQLRANTEAAKRQPSNEANLPAAVRVEAPADDK